MDSMKDLTTGAKVVLGATILFLIVSFFSWFDYSGPGSDELSAIGADTGVTMWHGVGVVAGLLAIVLLVWQAVRLANINLEIGVTPSMITAALAVLLLIFAFIRWIDKPGGDLVGRTFWSWLGLALAIVTVIGAWLNMQAAGESLSDVRASMAGAAASARGAMDRGDQSPSPSSPPPPSAPSEPAPPPAEAPLDDPEPPSTGT